MQLDIKRKKNTWLKSEQKNWRDIFPKRKCRWPTSTWKDAQHHFSSVQSLSCVWLFALGHARPPSPLPTSGVYSNSCPLSQWCHPTIILCHPLLLLPSVFPSIRVFSNESALRIRWPKYWSFTFSISPSSEHPGLISFRMDWLDLLAVQVTLKSLLQHHSSKASIQPYWLI